MTAVIALPRILRIGGGAVGEAAEVLALLGLSRPLIITDPMMVKIGLAERVQAILAGEGIKSAVLQDRSRT